MRVVFAFLVVASLVTGCGQDRLGDAPAPGESTDGFFCQKLEPGEAPAPDADPRCPAGSG